MESDWCIENDFATQKEMAETAKQSVNKRWLLRSDSDESEMEVLLENLAEAAYFHGKGEGQKYKIDEAKSKLRGFIRRQ